MSRLSSLFRSIALALVLACSAIPAWSADASAPSISQFLKIRAGGTPVLLPDGSFLQRDWPDGVWQLYRVTPKNPGPNASYAPNDVVRTQLTNFPDGIGAYSLSPDGKRCVIMHARGGNENTQLSSLDPLSPGMRRSAHPRQPRGSGERQRGSRTAQDSSIPRTTGERFLPVSL
jgi:hypothetical protein